MKELVTKSKPGRGFLGLLIIIVGLLSMRALAADAPPKTTEALIKALVADNTRRAAIKEIQNSQDMRLVPFLEDFMKSQVGIYKDQVVIEVVSGDKYDLLDALTRKPITTAPVAKTDVTSVDVTNAEARLVNKALTILRFNDPDPDGRIAAVIKAGDSGSEANLPNLQALLQKETHPRARRAIEESILRIQFEKSAAALIDRHAAATGQKLVINQQIKAATRSGPDRPASAKTGGS